jgi:predicted dehydrogenase
MIPSVQKRDDVEIVALCDLLIGRAEWAKTKYAMPDVPVFTSASKMLRQVKSDVVMVSTTDAHHAEVVVPALKAGQYVFCEKPLGTTRGQCRAIIEADDKAGGRTMIGHNLRYAPVYVKIKEMIETGVLGDVLTLQADEFYDQGRTYFRRWNGLRKEGGGLWITKASHDFDVLAWLANAKPLEVSAMAAKTYYVPKGEAAKQCRICDLKQTCPDKPKGGPLTLDSISEENGGLPYDLCLFNAPSDTFDHGMANVRFERDIFATYTCNVVAGLSDRRIRVAGTKGLVDGCLRSDTLTLVKRDPSETVQVSLNADVSNMHGGADRMILDDFFGFVKGTAQPKCRPRDAALAVAMGLAATRSSDTNKTVPVKRFMV